MSRTLIDHDSIRDWAEHHGATPASVRGTGHARDAGIIRLDFKGDSGAESLLPVDWDEWFRTFDDRQLALVVDDKGTAPDFNKLVARDSAAGQRAETAGRGGGAQASRDDMRAQDVDEDEEPSTDDDDEDPDDDESDEESDEDVSDEGADDDADEEDDDEFEDEDEEDGDESSDDDGER
jgi:hypothetical protein